jgi:hypothetical protein
MLLQIIVNNVAFMSSVTVLVACWIEPHRTLSDTFKMKVLQICSLRKKYTKMCSSEAKESTKILVEIKMLEKELRQLVPQLRLAARTRWTRELWYWVLRLLFVSPQFLGAIATTLQGLTKGFCDWLVQLRLATLTGEIADTLAFVVVVLAGKLKYRLFVRPGLLAFLCNDAKIRLRRLIKAKQRARNGCGSRKSRRRLDRFIKFLRRKCGALN